jgi:hypothetical protein
LEDGELACFAQYKSKTVNEKKGAEEAMDNEKEMNR